MQEKKKIIGVCVSQLHDMATSALIKNISKYAKDNGFCLLIYGCFAKMDWKTPFTKGEASIFSNIPMQQLSALVLLGQTILDNELLENLRNQALQAGTPVITVDYEMESCFNIQLDYDSPFEGLVRHVVEEHHCRNPFFMAGFRGNEFSDARMAIYEKVLREHGLPVKQEHIAYGDFWDIPARDACEKWLENTSDIPDAIICANDMMALAVCKVLEEHGYKVPEDVVVTGFDGIDLVNYCTPRLTTAQVDQEEIVRQMIGIIQKVIRQPQTEPYSVIVPFHLYKRESCGCEPVKAWDSNQSVMEVYIRMVKYQLRTEENFLMLTKLTEGQSMMEMLQKLSIYIKQVLRGDLLLFVNQEFCSHTDIPLPQSIRKESALLLLEQRGEKYAIPLQEIKDKSIDQIPEAVRFGGGQILFLPLHWQDEVYGYMALPSFREDIDFETLKDFIMMMTQTFGTVRKQSQLHELYIRDALTSLYNRRGFYGELTRRMKELGDKPKRIFLASVDLDKLKDINDNFGHSEGDVAITAIGSNLDKAIGEEGICARFGGDEFVAVRLWERDSEQKDYATVFQKTMEGYLKNWNEKEKKPYVLGASYGMVLDDISAVADIDELMKRADNAMYDCKDRHHRIRENRRD